MRDLFDTYGPVAQATPQGDSREAEIARLREGVARLIEAHPAASLEEHAERLIIKPALEGFDISLFPDATGGGWTLFLDGWFEERNSPDHALQLIELALRGDLRILRTTANGKPWRYTLEKRVEGALSGSLTSSSCAIREMTTSDAPGASPDWRIIGEIGYVRFFAFLARKNTEKLAYPSTGDWTSKLKAKFSD